MMKDRLNQLHRQITMDSIELIAEKQVDLEELAVRVDVTVNQIHELLQRRNKDLSLHLKIYDELVEW